MISFKPYTTIVTEETLLHYFQVILKHSLQNHYIVLKNGLNIINVQEVDKKKLNRFSNLHLIVAGGALRVLKEKTSDSGPLPVLLVPWIRKK